MSDPTPEADSDDTLAPLGEGTCFGCGAGNPHGLRLRFRPTGPTSVECEYTAPDHYCGAPGVIHGGIQATLLDEVLGHAAHHGAGGGEDFHLVTVDFRLRYRRPAPAGSRLRVRGRLLRVDGRDYDVEGEIVDEAGGVLTTAEARWRRIG